MIDDNRVRGAVERRGDEFCRTVFVVWKEPLSAPVVVIVVFHLPHEEIPVAYIYRYI